VSDGRDDSFATAVATTVTRNDPAETIVAEYGVNADYVLELLGQYRSDPALLDEEWRRYFADLLGAEPAPPPPPPPGAAPPPAPGTPSGTESDQETLPLRGAALAIAQNMKASLAVPTATSQRQIPIKLLDENRRLINDTRAANEQSKLSFTHLIAWAVLQALREFPGMNDGYDESGPEPRRIVRRRIHLGLAVDVERRDGARSLLVPNVRDAGEKTLGQLAEAIDDVVSRARSGRLSLPDFQGTTISLTNPGPMGTTSSIARLMPGQGAIVAMGAIEYPPGFSGLAPEAIARLGISKVTTLSSTYDHRIIQGAESGAFLGRIHELLLGEHEFYDRIFRELGIPFRPLRWAVDRNPALRSPDGARLQEIEKQARVLELINAYRVRGHLVADIDPLHATPVKNVPELDLETYGLTIWDLDREFLTGGLGGSETLPLRNILAILRRAYCGKVGVEYRFIPDVSEKDWVRRRVGAVPAPLDPEIRRQILWKLISAETFERFLHARFLGQKRFSIEGTETLIPLMDQLVLGAAERGIEEITIGMSHRGRLNVIANVIGHFCERIFASFEGVVHPDFPTDEGDVKYHRGASGERRIPNGRRVALTLAPNPSHLEFVDPVVQGMVRASQDARGERGPNVWRRALPVLVHGDAAFSGQGIVAETFNLSQLTGYRTGGTIHVVVNNQIGFTTSPDQSRSSLYSTDVAKINQVPIFHVNADDPEAAYRVLQIALDYRQEYHKDVVIDLVGFRRHGHNEGDEPSYTQPLMYRRVQEHPGVLAIYSRKLVREGVLTAEELDGLKAERQRRYEEAFEGARKIAEADGAPLPLGAEAPPEIADPGPETGVPRDVFAQIGRVLGRVPTDFHQNPKVMSLLARRAQACEGASPVDWATAEALAFGSLLLEGTPVRLSGEDSSRGTFSQRHMVIHDTRDGKTWTPLDTLDPSTARFFVFDSALSEAGVLGFEYGYSLNAPRTLTLWEAQYGDFVNAAQVIVDQFVVSGQDKWGQESRLVLLLPHGSEGQGPEHSSARPERFLELAVGGNLRVCQPSTPSQYFHLLRSQMRRTEARPLVVLTPKSLLRLPASFSPLPEMEHGRFRMVLPDSAARSATRLLLCSGKIYYPLARRRETAGLEGVAIARLEQYAPFPRTEVAELLSSLPDLREIVWVQEEPRNMGAWSYVEPRLREILPEGVSLSYAGRVESPSPATGSHELHVLEEKRILESAIP
jgi:2-oxoglutarate decarboxylase